VVARARPNDLDVARIGFVVGRRVGGAVARNRVRRRLRELARQAPITPGFDVVLYARPAAANASFLALAKAVVQALRRENIWSGQPADRLMATFPAAW
jgi:ribonuclease P protein component